MELVVGWLVANWTTIVIPTVVGFLSYFGARKKNKLDLTSQETDVLGEKWRLAITMLDDSTKRFKDTIDMMEEDNASLRKQNTELKDLVSTLTDKVDRLTREMRKLEKVVKYRSDDKSN
jgi:predicted RNase H-like nuclease (RuvC/YqgF family)